VTAVPSERTVILVGPKPDSRGGVAATVRGIGLSPLSERYRLLSVATFCDGSALDKLRQFARGIILLSRLTSRGDVAIVHLHASNGVSYLRKALMHALVRRRGIPVVYHVHPGPTKVDLERRGARGALIRWALRWSLERADVVIALTQGWGEELQNFAVIHRLTIVPNAPDLSAPVHRNGNPSGRPQHLLFLGHLYREKGIFELVAAFSRVREQRPELRLTMAGVGTEDDELRRQAGAQGLGDALRLAGWVSPEKKNALLASADCLVLPSYEEGLPLALLEAMASGVPVVATPVGGVAEVARHEVEALLVPPQDVHALAQAIERILGDPALANRLAGAARKRAEVFSPSAQARRIGEIYDGLLAGQK
jgi:glycosyltransferase involved in cell wall biosynthesis